MPELKSTSPQSKGRACEHKVLKLFQKSNYQLVCRNQKLWGVEVDLLFFKEHYTIVEVKALRSWDEAAFRVSRIQQRRLNYVLQRLQDHCDRVVELKYAFVLSDQIVLLDGSEL